MFVLNLMKVREKSMKEIKLKTQDGVKIAVNLYRNKFDKVVIIAPGWFMTKDSKSFKEMSAVFSKNADIIAMDFRGHGKSGGFYTFTSKEVEDISAVVEFAHRHYKTIYIMGFSLGAALALIAGAKYDFIKKLLQ